MYRLPASSMDTPSARGMVFFRPLKPPSRVMKLTCSPCSSSSSSKCDSADSTRVWPVRGSIPRADRLRRSSSSLGSLCLSPLSTRPSLLQVNNAGGRSSPSSNCCLRGSQATASKALFWSSEGPRSYLGKSAMFNWLVEPSTLTITNECSRSSTMAIKPSSMTATPSGLLQPTSGILRRTSPCRLSSTRKGCLPITENNVLVLGLYERSEASSRSRPGSNLASITAR